MCFQQDPDEDEIQPLLFDLVRTDKVQLIKTLIPRVEKCKWEVQNALYTLAVSSGSTAMIDLLVPIKYWDKQLLMAAIHSKNIENYRHILHSRRSEFTNVNYPGVLLEILKSKSEEFLLGWEICIDADYEDWRQKKEKKLRNPNVPYGERFIRKNLLKTARGDPGNEAFILTLWKKIDLAKELKPIYLGAALGNVAAACCSVKLAKYLTDAGAGINHRRSSQYLTPLHHAATQNNSEAAELMRFLLVLGADPAAYATSGGKNRKIRQIRDEAGAKGISKWLGMSWDDLVEKTKLENQN
jgi:hypothetical protein